MGKRKKKQKTSLEIDIFQVAERITPLYLMDKTMHVVFPLERLPKTDALEVNLLASRYGELGLSWPVSLPATPKKSKGIRKNKL